VNDRDDVYVLPPPAQFTVLDLGYDAAAIDLLWSKLLVDYGVHMAERRDFHPDPYLDTILFVEPTYKPLYHFADTFLCFRPLRGTLDDARKARAILERGTRERPQDPDVWLEYGQFTAFLGPAFLGDDKDERERWRHDGAVAIMKAVDLGADAGRVLSAASILSKSEERSATLAALQRAYAAAEDPAAREDIRQKMLQLQGKEAEEAIARIVETVEARWRASYPVLKRTLFLLVGPRIDPARCAGPSTADDPACARSWDDVVERASAP
jgi:hypothetical protein